MAILDDIWKELLLHTKYNNVVLSALYQWLQKQQAEKVADAWVPHYVVVNYPDVQQILGKNSDRAELYIKNEGPGAVAIAARYFDYNEAVALNTAAANGAIAPMLVLNSGDTTPAIKTHGAFYAYNLDYGSKTAILQIIETVYAVPHSSKNGQTPTSHGIAGLMEQGLSMGAGQEDRLSGRGIL